MKHLGDITKINGAEAEPVYKVYMYEFPNGKKYIGMTKNTLEERRDMGYHHNKELQSAIRSYGWRGFEHKVLIDNLTKQQAETMEIKLIEEYNTTDPQHGYNVSYGGTATFAKLKHTEEYKVKMSNINKGKVFSESHKNNIKKAHEKYAIKVISRDQNGNIERYSSLRDAARKVKGYASNISRAISSHKKYKGYIWEIQKEVV